MLAAYVSTSQRCTEWAGANRWHNNTIFAAMLVSWWCERAADGLCMCASESTDSVWVTQADASMEPGRCASCIALVKVALE